MAQKRITLASGAYQARSIIASAQRCVNLFPEQQPQETQEPSPVTHYQTPGLTLKAQSPVIRANRGMYRATNGALYTVIGTGVYYVSSSFAFTKLGTIADQPTPVSMVDNGTVVVLVDGTSSGYVIDMLNGNQFAQISDPAFYGATKVDYVDTYFVFNKPGTAIYYISLSQPDFGMLSGTGVGTGTITAAGTSYTNGQYDGVPLTGGSGTGATANIQVSGGAVVSVQIVTNGKNFAIGNVLSAAASTIGGTGSGFQYMVTGAAPAFNALDFAQKSGGPDPLVSLICVHREIWLVGTLAAEVAVNTGAADFTFGPLPGAYMEAGTVAPYTIARHSLSVFWLAQDRQGQCIAVMSQGYALQRISTYALEQEWQTYSVVSDAIGFTYQLNGHEFYAIAFPTQDITWVYDIGTGQWHQWAYVDDNGKLHRHRANSYAFAYGFNLVGDWQSGNIYALDTNAFTDNGQEIIRIRSFPHLMGNAARVTYVRFIADIAVGSSDNGSLNGPQVNFEVIKASDGKTYFAVLSRNGGSYIYLPPDPVNGREVLTLRFSDDRGATWSSAIQQNMGAEGEYIASVEFMRLGMARDRIFELSWSGNCKTALNGAFIDVMEHAS